MKLIKPYWKNTVLLKKKIVSFLFVCFLGALVVGCGSKPKVSDAQNKIKIETELAKFDLAKSSLSTMRDSVSSFQTQTSYPEPPEPLHMFSLTLFLENNDCTMLYETGQLASAKECYRLTVLRLIKETYYADKLTDRVYQLEVNNFQYGQTVDAMFKALGIPEPVKP